VHLVNPKTGKVLGGKEDETWQATMLAARIFVKQSRQFN